MGGSSHVGVWTNRKRSGDYLCDRNEVYQNDVNDHDIIAQGQPLN